jgi:uncharacterized protein YdeI (YjbR/CyaY-like superfamily)
MKTLETFHTFSRNEFRRWLSENHSKKTQIWLILYKKASGKQTFSHDDALEEAICYGWIDNRTRSIDEQKFAIRFTPRHRGSPWSTYNKTLALKMLRAGKITEAGKAVLPAELLTLLGAD